MQHNDVAIVLSTRMGEFKIACMNDLTEFAETISECKKADQAAIYTQLIAARDFPALMEKLKFDILFSNDLIPLRYYFTHYFHLYFKGDYKALIKSFFAYEWIAQYFMVNCEFLSVFAKHADADLDDLVLTTIFDSPYYIASLANVPLRLNECLRRLPTSYAQRLLDSVLSEENHPFFDITDLDLLGIRHLVLTMMNSLPDEFAIAIFQKWLDHQDVWDLVLNSTKGVPARGFIESLFAMNKICSQMLLEKLLSDKNLWLRFITSLRTSDQCLGMTHMYILRLLDGDHHYYVLRQLEKFNISLLHNLIANGRNADAIELLNMGANPCLNEEEIGDGMDHLLSVIGYVNTHAIVELVIAMLKKGIDPANPRYEFDTVFLRAFHSGRALINELLALGAQPKNAVAFFGSLVKDCEDVNDYHTFYYGIARFSPLRQLLAAEKVLCARYFEFGAEALKTSSVAEVKFEQRIAMDGWVGCNKTSKNIFLTLCIMYALDYHSTRHRDRFSLLPVAIFLKIALYFVADDKYATELFNASLLKHQILKQWKKHESCINVLQHIDRHDHSTFSFFVSTEALALKYETMKRARVGLAKLKAFRAEAVEHVAHEPTLFKLPAHKRAWENQMQDVELYERVKKFLPAH